MSDHETVEQSLAYQLGRRSAFQEIDELLERRAPLAKPGDTKAECVGIRVQVVRPLLQESFAEAYRLSDERETNP